MTGKDIRVYIKHVFYSYDQTVKNLIEGMHEAQIKCKRILAVVSELDLKLYAFFNEKRGRV